MAPPNHSSFSVSVVLPASGWEMIAKVRRREISSSRTDTAAQSKAENRTLYPVDRRTLRQHVPIECPTGKGQPRQGEQQERQEQHAEHGHTGQQRPPGQ